MFLLGSEGQTTEVFPVNVEPRRGRVLRLSVSKREAWKGRRSQVSILPQVFRHGER